MHRDSLSIDFYPSFIYSSKLLITKGEKSDKMQLSVFKAGMTQLYTDTTVKLKKESTDSLWKFLKIYKFRIKGSTDTIGSFKALDENGDSTLIYKVTSGLDGITVNGAFNDGARHKFAFWSPKKGTENHQLINIIFSLLNQSVNNKKAAYYIEALSQYFSFGLGLKQLSSSPLKYKLFGALSAEKELQLKAFFNSLPQKPNIIIDVSNLNGMGTLIYPLFKNLMDSHENIYWLNPNDIVLFNFYEIGIPAGSIISAKKVIGIKTNKEGREEIVTEPKTISTIKP